MTIFLPDMNVISTWITAHLIAFAMVNTLIMSRYLNKLISRLEDAFSNPLIRSSARMLVYLLMGMFIISPLMIFIRSAPVRLWTTHTGKSPLIDASRLSIISAPVIGDLLIVFQIFVLLSTIPITNRFFLRLVGSIQVWRRTRFRAIKVQELVLLTPEQIANVMTSAAKYVKLGAQILVISVCLTLLFSLYPVTEGVARTLWAEVIGVMTAFWNKFIAFIPNLITLIAIGLIARTSLKLLRYFYMGVRRGKIRHTGIHYELVEPTYQILRFLVVAFALVAAFPYIPGSSSPVFRGLSIFVGFLLSLGSTSLVTNIVAGIVLTYSRGLKIGDRVTIAASTGDVIERTLLVTRIRTIKNQVVTMPNALVLKNEIVNYSTDAEERGLILHTSITIGYDVPWRRVQELLMNAAAKTPNVLASPSPFVFKTGLEDSYIRYELNAYTTKPSTMADTYSDLHQNILDEFDQAGIEITSPSYLAVRYGNGAAIPEIEPTGNGREMRTSQLEKS